MVRPDVVSRKIGRASGWLTDAEKLLGQVKLSERDRDLAVFYIFLAVQECIDLATHWIADAGWSPADDAGGCFDVLGERGVIDESLAEQMRAAVGLRNRIAHGYATIDQERLAKEAPSGIASLRLFLLRISSSAGAPSD